MAALAVAGVRLVVDAPAVPLADSDSGQAAVDAPCAESRDEHAAFLDAPPELPDDVFLHVVSQGVRVAHPPVAYSAGHEERLAACEEHHRLVDWCEEHLHVARSDVHGEHPATYVVRRYAVHLHEEYRRAAYRCVARSAVREAHRGQYVAHQDVVCPCVAYHYEAHPLAVHLRDRAGLECRDAARQDVACPNEAHHYGECSDDRAVHRDEYAAHQDVREEHPYVARQGACQAHPGAVCPCEVHRYVAR